MDWDPPPSAKQIQLVGPMSSSQTSAFAPSPRVGGGGGGESGGTRAGVGSGGLLTRRGSGSLFLDRIGITRIPDRAWTITLDYLDLGEVGGVRDFFFLFVVFFFFARGGRGRKAGLQAGRHRCLFFALATGELSTATVTVVAVTSATRMRYLQSAVVFHTRTH